MMPTLQPFPAGAITLMPTHRERGLFQGISTSIPSHGPASDLADLVLDSPASVGALVHRGLVHLHQERRRRRSGRQPLLLPYPRERLEVLACPVDVYATGDAVPLLIRCLGAALRTTHSGHPGPPLFQGSSRCAS